MVIGKPQVKTLGNFITHPIPPKASVKTSGALHTSVARLSNFHYQRGKLSTQINEFWMINFSYVYGHTTTHIIPPPNKHQSKPMRPYSQHKPPKASVALSEHSPPPPQNVQWCGVHFLGCTYKFPISDMHSKSPFIK